MGQIIKVGGKLGSTYADKPEEAYNLINDFYNAQFRKYGGMRKAAGAAVYGDNGYFNAIMGKEITAGMFASDNIFTAIGAHPYDHEGVRIATDQPTYAPIGAGTVQDGNIDPSIAMPVDEFKEPYKDLPMSFDYGLGLKTLENKDDTIAYQDYVDKMAASYSDRIDKAITKPITFVQPDVGGVETSLNGISRAIASATEIGKTYGSTTITAGMVTPYGGGTTSSFWAYRGNASAKNNLCGQVVDGNGGSLTTAMLKKLYRQCSTNWVDSANPNNKMWAMSPIAMDKTSALLMASNILLDSVFVQRDFNGVKTMPGRDGGLLLSAFQNVPIITDGNICFDYSDGVNMVSDVMMGDIGLYDLNHLFMRILTPVEMYTNNNIAVTMKLREVNVMTSRMELGINKTLCHGRVTNLADDI